MKNDNGTNNVDADQIDVDILKNVHDAPPDSDYTAQCIVGWVLVTFWLLFIQYGGGVG